MLHQVEVSSRVTAVKDRCAAAKLPSKLSPVSMDTVNLPKPLPTADLSVSSFERDYEAMVRLRDELKDKLQAAIEQAEDLE